MKTFLSFLLLLLSLTSYGQNWTWMSGSDGPKLHGDYGTKGVPAATNKPGARTGSVSWKDNAGNVWIFGGYGYAAQGGKGALNDLWRYTELTGIWTWMNGANTVGQLGSYSTKGIPSSSVHPGARLTAGGWIDNSGSLWLFGGAAASSSKFNDLWKYNPGTDQWTWVKGDSLYNQDGIYGTPGVAAASNAPGSRSDFAFWKDNAGNFWMFGGVDTSYSVMCGANDWYDYQTFRSDLWKYNPALNEWIWMHGDSTYNAVGLSGTKGFSTPANRPGARAGSAAWKDTSGNLWLFGGYYDPGPCQWGKNYNSLWKYDITANQWTWMKGDSINGWTNFGTKGVGSTSTTPGYRTGSYAWAEGSKLWLFGGYGWVPTAADGSLNDLWQYDIVANQWTWMAGDQGSGACGVYGIKGQSTPFNKPGARSSGVSWPSSGKLRMFGGDGMLMNGADLLGDLWQYDPAIGEWTWLDGNNTLHPIPTYGIKGVLSSAHFPGARENGATWTDSNNNLWLFGGKGYTAQSGAAGLLNELWKFNPTLNQWAWMHGDSLVNSPGLYGTKGVSSASNRPKSRESGARWKDRSNHLWLFGGKNNNSVFNDLWKYDIALGQWTWMSGDNVTNQPAVYGTQNISSPANKPGARCDAIGWEDTSGKFWLFGGYNASGGRLNDLWRFDPSSLEWTWMHGDSIANQSSVFGTTNTFSATAKPSGTSGFYWKDKNGFVWMMGDANKLWKFNPSVNQWALITGLLSPSHFDGKNQYGKKGFSDFRNRPASRVKGGMWIDSTDNLWMYGGTGDALSVGSWPGALNSVWKFDPQTNEWNWMQGDSVADKNTVYGLQGITSAVNDPGGRNGVQYWQDTSGNFWFFGGSKGYWSLFGDMWKRDGCATPGKPSTLNTSAPFLCAGSTYILSVPPQSAASSFVWSLPSTWAGTSNTSSISAKVYPYNWTENVEVYATNACGNSAKLWGGPVVSQPPTPVIAQSGNNLYTSGLYVSYQWYFNGQPIPGAIFPNYAFTQNGNYYLIVIDNVSCTGQSNTIGISTGINDTTQPRDVVLFPNPTRGVVSIHTDARGVLRIRNLQGLTVFEKRIDEGKTSFELPESLTFGVYIATFIEDHSSKQTNLRLIYQK